MARSTPRPSDAEQTSARLSEQAVESLKAQRAQIPPVSHEARAEVAAIDYLLAERGRLALAALRRKPGLSERSGSADSRSCSEPNEPCHSIRPERPVRRRSRWESGDEAARRKTCPGVGAYTRARARVLPGLRRVGAGASASCPGIRSCRRIRLPTHPCSRGSTPGGGWTPLDPLPETNWWPYVASRQH